MIEAVLAARAAITETDEPPQVRAIAYALEYGHADYIPSLSRIWSVPDDLPHAAGMGDMVKVARWFDAEGQPTIGDPDLHNPFPAHSPKFSEQDVIQSEQGQSS